MSGGIAELELAMLDLAADALAACGRPVPDRKLRYHGDVAVQCCDGNGLLTAHWNPVTMDRTGLPPGQLPGMPIGKRQADIYLRLYRCHPTLKADGSFPEDEGDAAVAALANDMDCLVSAFGDAICAGTLNPYLAGCDGLALVSVAPRRPSGGCAGIELRFAAQWQPWTPAVS